jgi:hypothetical protein
MNIRSTVPPARKSAPMSHFWSTTLKRKVKLEVCLGLGLDDIGFHRMDANKNRVRGNLSSPYIPNLYYYRPDWTAPARFPI